MSTLTENALRHVEQSMLDLSGDEDFLPFMTIKDRRGDIALVGMMMPDDPEAKDRVADMMTAMCLVHGGVEVTFASSSWMVTHNPDSPYKMGQPPPSRHPDRVEVAFVAAIDTEGRYRVHTAPVIRENNMVAVGLWSESETTEPSGRFAEAIHMGMQLSAKLPTEIREHFDAEADAGRLEELVQKTTQLVYEARKGVSRN